MSADDNPYESPNASASIRRVRSVATSEGDEKTGRQAQFFLRLIGVLLCVEGLSGMVGSLVYALINPHGLPWPGPDVETNAYVSGWMAGSVVLLAGGLYLVIGGRWLIEAVFLPSAPPDVMDSGVAQPHHEP